MAYKLRLAQLAEQDLSDLYYEGLTRWGEVQADAYYTGLLQRFERICDTPLMYPAVNEIRDGYRRCVYEKHAIYFVIDEDAIEIRAVVKHQNIATRL